MKLIGASDFVVRSPFLFEGIILGLIGAAIPLIIIYYIYNEAIKYVIQEFAVLNSILAFLPVEQIFYTLVPIALILGVGIGFLGSAMTVRRHLRV
jgi:cell division transport system permease protein